MLSKIRKIMQVSIIKTIRFNAHYFGLKGLYKLPVIVSKNMSINTLKGSVFIENFKPGIVKLGFGDMGLFYRKYDKGIWKNNGDIIFKGSANIGHGSKVTNSSILEFGDNFIITAKSEIICYKKIIFGDNCLLSWDSLIMDTDAHKIYDDKGNYFNPDKEIIIEDNVWIGCRNLILKGSYIPKGSVVAANSTISRNFKNNKSIIIGGNNKILKENISWES